jgi:hypothetical protein
VQSDYVWRRTDRWIDFPWSTLPPVVQRRRLDESAGGGRPSAAGAVLRCPQYRKRETEVCSADAIRATSSMAVWASPIAWVVEPVAVATAAMFSAI